jgi:hypothetical protein
MDTAGIKNRILAIFDSSQTSHPIERLANAPNI